MSWLLIALIAPFIWSIVNHVDKIILSRYFHSGGSGGLMIFVGIVALPFAICIAFFEPTVLFVPLSAQAYLITSGLLYNIGIFYYLRALERHDASYVVPFWQLIPVFTYVFGLFFLNEYLESARLIGGVVVIFGAVFLSARFGRTWSLDTKTVGIMIFSSACMALGYIFFKHADGFTGSFLSSIFWNQIGMTLFAAIFYFVPAFYEEFWSVVKQNSGKILTLNLAEQIAEIVGVLASNFAVLLAPTAIVILVEYTAQPVFALIFGLILSIFIPHLVQEDTRPWTLAQRAFAIFIMCTGLVLVV